MLSMLCRVGNRSVCQYYPADVRAYIAAAVTRTQYDSWYAIRITF